MRCGDVVIYCEKQKQKQKQNTRTSLVAPMQGTQV